MLLAQKKEDQFPFTHIQYYGNEQGLNGSQVYSVTQDSLGFLWFITENGLNRFDGYSFRSWSYKASDPASLSIGQYWGLTQDKNGVIWIPGSTTQALYSFNPKQEKFSIYRNQPGNSNSLNATEVMAIVAEPNGMIWAGTRGGLDKFDPQTKTFTHFLHSEKDTTSIYSNRVIALVEDESKPGILWILDEKTLGLDCFNSKTTKVAQHFNFPFSKSLYSSYLQALQNANPPINVAEMKNGNIWMGSNDNGIFGFNAHTQQFIFIPITRLCHSSDHLPGFYYVKEDDAGNLWTTNDNNEVVYYDMAAKKFYFLPIKQNNIRFMQIASIIYEDRSHKIWFCTNNGLLTIDTRQKDFFCYRHNTNEGFAATSDFIYGLYRTRQGNFLVGTGSGVDRFDSKTKSFSHFPLFEHGKDFNADGRWTIMQDSKDIVWFAGRAGIASYNPFTKKSRQYHLYNDSSDIRNANMIGIAEDKNGKYWTANLGGGFCSFDPVSGYARGIDVCNENDSNSVTALGELFVDSKGLLHVYGWEAGFITFDPETEKFKMYRHDPADSTSVSHQYCHSFIETKNAGPDKSGGLIWFATLGGGINVFNPATGKFKAFTTKDGLSNNMVRSLVQDKNGNFWAATGVTCQLSCFTPSADPFIPGCRIKFRNYDRSDGLPSATFTKYSAYCDDDGTLYFGTQGGGLISFHPDSLKDNDFIPPVSITEFSLRNKPVSKNDSNSVLQSPIEYTRTITLNYRQNIISFAFAALNYIHPEKNSHAYKLEPFDKDWIYTDASHRFANYTNLDPGEYTFKVKGSNNDGVWNETPTKLKIIITPPFWQTTWFKILVALAVAAIIYSFYRYRIGQILLLQRIRNKIAADLHDDIGSTLNSIALYSDLAKKQPAQRDRALDMIGESARKIIDSMSDIVWMINPKNDSFDKIIFRMRSLTQDVLRTKKIDCQFKYDETLNEVSLPMGIRRNIYLIFKEALNNIIKYSNANRASIKMIHENKNIILIISDNGVGFDHSVSYNGNGINNMVQRAEEIGAKIKIESEQGIGTNIELNVRL